MSEVRDVAVAPALFGDRRAKRGRHDEPADAQAGPECLARGAEVHHSVRCEALERADGVTVVAELAVVVVLDDPRVAIPRPSDEARAALGAHDRAQRILVSGRDDDGGRGGGSEHLDVDPLVVDRHRRETQAFALQDRVVEGKAGLLDGDGRRTTSMQQPRQLAETTACAWDHDRRVGGRHRVACAVQVARNRSSELAQPGGVAVAEQIVGSGRQHLACATQPRRTRESAGVGLARDQIESEVRARRLDDGVLDDSTARPRHTSARAWTRSRGSPRQRAGRRPPRPWRVTVRDRRPSPRLDGTASPGSRRPARIAARNPASRLRCLRVRSMSSSRSRIQLVWRKRCRLDQVSSPARPYRAR